MNRQSPIGIFDSGIGGLTAANAIHQLLPKEQLIYFGDTAHLPYGDKSTAAIQAYSIKICNVLMSQGVKMILIACNSASSTSYNLIKEYVGSRALILNVIDPLVSYLGEKYSAEKIGLIGTKRTINSNSYKSKIDGLGKDIRLSSLATPLLAPMIEEGFFENNISEQIIANYLSNEELDGVSALILGCTHYPLIKNEIEKYYNKKVAVLDASEIVAKKVQEMLYKRNLLTDRNEKKHHFYVSDYTPSFQKSTKIFFGEKVKLEHYKLWE